MFFFFIFVFHVSELITIGRRMEMRPDGLERTVMTSTNLDWEKKGTEDHSISSNRSLKIAPRMPLYKLV
jgi:hypothetical protein